MVLVVEEGKIWLIMDGLTFKEGIELCSGNIKDRRTAQRMYDRMIEKRKI